MDKLIFLGRMVVVTQWAKKRGGTCPNEAKTKRNGVKDVKAFK